MVVKPRKRVLGAALLCGLIGALASAVGSLALFGAIGESHSPLSNQTFAFGLLGLGLLLGIVEALALRRFAASGIAPSN